MRTANGNATTYVRDDGVGAVRRGERGDKASGREVPDIRPPSGAQDIIEYQVELFPSKLLRFPHFGVTGASSGVSKRPGLDYHSVSEWVRVTVDYIQ